MLTIAYKKIEENIYKIKTVFVEINKKIAQFLDLKKGAEVYIHPENKHKISIEI